MSFHQINNISKTERTLRRGRFIAPTADLSASYPFTPQPGHINRAKRHPLRRGRFIAPTADLSACGPGGGVCQALNT